MDKLEKFRKRASELSGGKSNSAVNTLVWKLLNSIPLGGTILDFGAGRGNLTRQLLADVRFTRVDAVDLMERPSELDERIAWHVADLNGSIGLRERYDVIVCSEVIEHLENPRATMRSLNSLLNVGGILVLTMPNQECLRSLVGLIFGGHFVHFLGDAYPAHITALLRLDLERISAEVGFGIPTFSYSNQGGIPKRPGLTWQSISFGSLRGRWFSDNIGLIARKL